MPRPHHYRKLHKWALGLPSKFEHRSSKYASAAFALHFNVVGIQGLALLPAFIAGGVDFEYLYKLKGFNIKPSEILRWPGLVDRHTSDSLPRISMAHLYGSILTATWTAFEVFAGDLWEAVVNRHPAQLSDRRLDAKSVHGGGDPRVIPIASIGEASDNTFDLSNRMGSLLREKESFDSLHGIRRAYSRAFRHRTRPQRIQGVLGRRCLDALCEVRNVLVHRAGIPDKAYIEKTKSLRAAPRAKYRGEAIEIHGKTVVSLAGPVILAAYDLLEAIELWTQTQEVIANVKAKNKSAAKTRTPKA